MKGPAHVLRLAGTLAYLDWAMELVGTPAPTTIEARFVAGAVRLVVNYFWPHAQAALRQVGLTEQHAKARRVLRWLRAERGPEDEVSLQDIRRTALGQSLDAEATTKLIDSLVRAGWLRRAPTVKTDGRPVYRWQINPLLWDAESAGSAESPSDKSEQPLSALSGFLHFPHPLREIRAALTKRRSHGRPDPPPTRARCRTAGRSGRHLAENQRPKESRTAC